MTASIVMVDDAGAVAESYEWLANPGVDIPEEASAIHGVTTAHAQANGRPADQVAAEVAAVLATLFANNIPVIAFNASYDFTVLAHEARRHGLEQITPAPVIDPFICNKNVDKFHGVAAQGAVLCRKCIGQPQRGLGVGGGGVGVVELDAVLLAQGHQGAGVADGQYSNIQGYEGRISLGFHGSVRLSNEQPDVISQAPIYLPQRNHHVD